MQRPVTKRHCPAGRQAGSECAKSPVSAAGILLVGVPVSAANADASAGHNAVHFTLTCAGEKFAVVSPSEPAAAVQIVGISSVLLGTDALLTTTYTDPQTGQLVTDTQHIVYGAGRGSANGTQDHAIHCADTTVVNDPTLDRSSLPFSPLSSWPRHTDLGRKPVEHPGVRKHFASAAAMPLEVSGRRGPRKSSAARL